MKAVTFTVKLTDSNIELLQEFKENKQLGLLIRTYFDALACDRGGTLANLIGLSGGDVVRSSITATTEVANHYKAYLDAGLQDKLAFSDYLGDVEKFQKLPYEGYYGRGLTEKAVRGILENFLSEMNLNTMKKEELVSETMVEEMVARVLEQKLTALGVIGAGVVHQKPISLTPEPIEFTSEDTLGVITPKEVTERFEGSETAHIDVEEVETQDVSKPVVDFEVDTKVVNSSEDDSSLGVGIVEDGVNEVSDLLNNLGF